MAIDSTCLGADTAIDEARSAPHDAAMPRRARCYRGANTALAPRRNYFGVVFGFSFGLGENSLEIVAPVGVSNPCFRRERKETGLSRTPANNLTSFNNNGLIHGQLPLSS